MNDYGKVIRRLASHHVYLDNRCLGLQVVELIGKKVVKIFPLKEEIPFTELITDSLYIQTLTDGSQELLT